MKGILMSALEELEAHYPEIVELMSDEFDSHDFILVLAREHQQLYVQALSGYTANQQPFQTVHAEIAKRLCKRNDLVHQVEKHSSPNIFGIENQAAVWRKVGVLD